MRAVFSLAWAISFVMLFSSRARADEPQQAAAPLTHSFLATGGRTYLMQFDRAHPQGEVVWEYKGNTREGWVLPSGNILLAVSKGGGYPGGGAIEITREHTIAWEYKGTQDEVNSVQKTPEGTYVITEAGRNPRLLELDADGKTLVEFSLACQKTNSHMETRMARKLADGTYLCPHLLDFAVKQYDKTGKVLHSLDTALPGDAQRQTHTWPFTAIRLPNGNTLCGLTHGNRVAEFDSTGKKVWELTNDDVGGIIKDACGVQRLPNGNTVVASYASKPGEVRLFEVTPEKKVVWKYLSSDRPGIHHFHILDTNGAPLAGPPLR